MRNKLTIVVILIMLLSWSVVHAEKDMEKVQKENQNVNQAEKKSAKKSKNNKVLKEFTPSEEISIDKPVAFPVDI